MSYLFVFGDLFECWGLIGDCPDFLAMTFSLIQWYYLHVKIFLVCSYAFPLLRGIAQPGSLCYLVNFGLIGQQVYFLKTGTEKNIYWRFLERCKHLQVC